jgi:hypothetical protein
MALSGLQISAGIDTSYRLAASNTAVTFLTASADARSYILSEAAQIQAPDVRGNDFSDATLSFGIRHRRILSEGALPTDFAIQAGRTWYSGDPYTQFINASVGQSFVIDPQNRLSLSLSARQQNSLTDDEPVETASLSTRWVHARANNDTLSLGAIIKRAKSDSVDSDYLATTYRATYDFADSFQGMKFGFGVDAEFRDFDASRYVSGPREDRSLALNFSVEFTDWEFYGFRPVMNVEAKRNKSNVDLFDRDYGSFGFDLRSSF